MNIFNSIIPNIGETFTTLFENKKIKIIQIVSSDSVEKKVYIQEEDEFVFILEGSAKLRIDGDIKEITKGEYLYIPAQTPHEILETTHGTLWLAIHF